MRRYRDLAERTFAKRSLLSKLERVGTSTLEQGSGQLPSHRGTRNALKKKDLRNPQSFVKNEMACEEAESLGRKHIQTPEKKKSHQDEFPPGFARVF
jgi:hypothetical protein